MTMHPSMRVRPLGWVGSLIAFLIVASTIYVTHYVLVPAYTARTGHPYLVGYLWGWTANMAIVFAVSLVAYKLEGHPISWQAFSARYRLGRMPAQDWLWTLAVLVGVVGAYFGLSFTAQWLAQIPLFAPHPAYPPDLGPEGLAAAIPGQLFGMPLRGQWWVAGVYLVGWILNILGEEFFYRGWMLPSQELAFGRYAWLVNGTMFALQHTLQPWNYLAIWPGALFMVYVVQRRRNTWIGIIQHGLMNLSLFVYVLLGVSGWG
jgi:membrane protease YdiL (CAAX protease family)